MRRGANRLTGASRAACNTGSRRSLGTSSRKSRKAPPPPTIRGIRHPFTGGQMRVGRGRIESYDAQSVTWKTHIKRKKCSFRKSACWISDCNLHISVSQPAHGTPSLSPASPLPPLRPPPRLYRRRVFVRAPRTRGARARAARSRRRQPSERAIRPPVTPLLGGVRIVSSAPGSFAACAPSTRRAR